MSKKVISRQCNRRAFKRGLYRDNDSLIWDDDDVARDDADFWEDDTNQRERGKTSRGEWVEQAID